MRWDDPKAKNNNVFKDMNTMLEQDMIKKYSRPTTFVIGRLSYYMLMNYNSPKQFILRTERPRVKVTICGHTSIMPRWYWRLLIDLQYIRDFLHLAWWTEQHPLYWKLAYWRNDK